jgi:L-2-hydroxyglutarate oxidase LhgO
VGLTVGLELQRCHPGASILIVEKEAQAGLHASGRNSGVLHSGIYYPPDSLKSKVCIAGAKAMQSFAREHGITCRRDGKIIIAASERDQAGVDRLLSNAAASHIPAERLTEADILRHEPHAQAIYGGLYSPDTCVIDSIAVVRKCVELFQKAGGKILFDAAVTSADPAHKTLVTRTGERLRYSFLVNCAGAYADRIAHWFGVGTDYVLVPFKGVYFQLSKDRDDLVHKSIYPVPNLELPFLGVHFTRVANGKVYIGPTAIPALGRENYGIFSGLNMEEAVPILMQLLRLYRSNQNNMRTLVNAEVRKYLKPYFLKAAQKLVPSVRSEDLVPCDKVGIRPQLINVRERRLEMDYILERTPDSLHVLNAISPAFTSSFAFSAHIVHQI